MAYGLLSNKGGTPAPKKSGSAAPTGGGGYGLLSGGGKGAPASSTAAVAGVVDPTDIAKAQKGIDNHLTKILESEAPESEKKAAKKKSVGDQAKGLFGKVIGGLDVGRANVAAALHQIERVNPRAKTVTKLVDQYGNVGNEGDTLTRDGEVTTIGPDVVTKGAHPSFKEDVKKHIGIREILEENPTFHKLPTPLKIGAGLVGDIAVDPLSYLAPESAIEKMGGKVGVAKALEEAGLKEAGAKVLRSGVSAASKEELKAVGIRGGLYFNVPGTGRIANRGADIFGKKIALKQIQLLKHGGVASALPRAIHLGANAILDRSAVAAFIGKHGAGKNTNLKADIRSGDPERAFMAQHALDAMNRGPAKGAGFEAEMGAKVRPLIEDAEKKGLSGQDLFHAVAGDPEAVAKAEKLGVDLEAHRAWWDEIHERANLIADPTGKEQWLAKADNYVARIRSEAARAKLGGRVGTTSESGGRASFEMSRLKPGEDWMGYKLVKPGDVDEATGEVAKSVEKQIADINTKVFGGEAVPLFEDDYRKVVGAYLSGMGKRVGDKFTERLMVEKGVIQDRYANLRPSKRYLKRVAKAQKLDQEAEDLLGQEQVAAAEASRAKRALDTHNANAVDEVTAAGREHRRTAEVLQRAADESAAARDSISAQVAEKMQYVRDARQRVSTIVGETNHPYETYTDLLDRRQGLQDSIDRLNDAVEDGSAIAKEQAKNPALRGAVQKRLEALDARIAELEGHPLVEAHEELYALEQQREDLLLTQQSGKETRAQMRELNLEMNKLNDKLDKLASHPRVVSGLREGMDLAEAKASNLRRLLAEWEGVTDPAVRDQLGRELAGLADGRTYGPEEQLPRSFFDTLDSRVQKAVDKLDTQGELHRRELTRLGEDPDIVPPRELPAIEHDILTFKPHYETALKRAKVWREAQTRATLWAGTPLHQDAVEAAEAIKRLKQQSGFKTLGEINEQVAALRDHLKDLQAEHFARRAYEGQILPERLAGTAEQVRQQIHRVQKARESLGVEWNIYDERLSKMEHELSALKADEKGVLQHAERPNSRFGPSEGTQTSLWYHYTPADDVNMLLDPTASGQLNTWGGLHAADNPLSSSELGIGNMNNRITFEVDSDKVKAYGEDPMGYGDPSFPHPQTEVNSEGGSFNDVYGIPNSLAEAEQQADMFRAAWDAEILTPHLLAARSQGRDAKLWNDVAKIMEEDPNADVIEAIAHVRSGGTAEDFAGPEGLGFEDGSHPLSPAYAKIHELAWELPTDVREEVRAAYREAMRKEGYDAVVYWNETENAAENLGGGAHWSIIMTNPAAVRIVDHEGTEAFRAMDFHQYSDYIEHRASTGIDRQLLSDTEDAIVSQKEIVGQAEAAWADDVQSIQAKRVANQEALRQVEERVTNEVGEMTERAKRLAADEYHLLHEAQGALARAESAEVAAYGPLVQESMRLHAASLTAEAKLANLGHARLEAQQVARLAWDKAVTSFSQVAVDALHDGMKPWGQGKMIPEHVAEALNEVQKVITPEGMQKALQYHDKALGIWKAYAIATPGFHFRNFFGGQFNMYVQGVDLGVQRRFIRAHYQFSRAFEKSLNVEEALTHIKDVKYREVYGQLHDAGIMAQGGQISHEITRGITQRGNINPLSTSFAPLKASAQVGEHLETVMRGASGAHVLLNGGSIDDAMAAIYKYHFNYDDLSKFERGVAKRVIPFYTWTRKNFTLQIEQLIRQPVKYKRYLDVKRNVEFGTREQGAAVPDYFKEGLGIRLPFKAQGQSAYLLPDIPFKSLAMDKPSEFLSSASPFVKTPVELWAGKQFFAGLPISEEKTIAPRAWQDIPFLMPSLSAIGKAQKDKQGRWIMSGKDSYLVEQFITPLGRARRLAPNEAKYQQRQVTTLLSFAFGVGVRANTVQGQYSELRRRDRQLSSVIADLQQRGYLEKKESAT